MTFKGLLGAITIATALPLLTTPALADKAEEKTQTLVSVHQFLRDEPSADPDRAQLRYGFIGGRWQAMGGGSVVFVGGPIGPVRAAIALEGFVELLNFTTDQPVPWESFRANIGFNTLWEVPSLNRSILPRGGRLFLALGWFHESDHAANHQRYMNDYLKDPSFFQRFDNANFSAYEYVKLRLSWKQPLWGGFLTTQTTLGGRYFPPPINPGSIRGMQSAFQTEVRVRVRATKTVQPFVAGYFEFVNNGFVADQEGFVGGENHHALRYQTISTGVDLRAASGAVVSPEIVYSNSHGRGIDFPRFYGSEFGFRLNFLL